MRIAIASGKGGTGKTTVAANLAAVSPHPITVIDCDVEQPNVHLFLHPAQNVSHDVTVRVPSVNADVCTSCGLCADVCEFNAIAFVGKPPDIFPELCHGCGGCLLACPVGAITEIERPVGQIEVGESRGHTLVTGRLNVREVLAPAVIRQVKQFANEQHLTLIDCPPGTACAMVTAVHGADFALLVTEPTPFGLHDLSLAVETLRLLKVPFAVVINRADTGDWSVREYCAAEGIYIFSEIPYDRSVAEAYSRGVLAVDVSAEQRRIFVELLNRLHDPDILGRSQSSNGGNSHHD